MRFERPRPRRRRRWLRWLVLGTTGFLAVIVVLGFIGTIANKNKPQGPSAGPPTVITDKAQSTRPPLVFTYFYYWYDATTGGHLEPNVPLATHPTDDPPPSWRSADWFRKELSDMAYAGIDVVLPVYWATKEDWPLGGLPVLAQAKAQLMAEGKRSPGIGMFFDTASLEGRDLTTAPDRDFMYANIREYFQRIPRDQWGLIDGRPVIWLFTSDFVTAFDQQVFDEIYTRFEQDFGVRPYIVREVSWNFAGHGRGSARVYDHAKPIATEASYVWGAAQNGFASSLGTVATVGPGYDERDIPGRAGVYRPRDGGKWYTDNFRKAIASGKRMLAIETWNELHEGSGIGETVEYGRAYIDLTRQLVAEYKRSFASAAP